MATRVKFVQEWKDSSGNAYEVDQVVDLDDSTARQAKDGEFAIDWVGMTSDEPAATTSSS